MNLIEKEFYADIKDKKRTGAGIFSCKGKRGYVGKMLFPSDIMSRKDKYNHRKAGKCVTTNMYDTMISYEEFNKLSDEDMRKHLIEYRNRFVNEDIRLHWGMSKKGFDTFITDMKLPRAPRTKVDTSGKRKVRGGTGSKKKFRRNTEEIVESALTIVKPQAEVVYQEPVVLPKIDGLSLTYTGIYDPKQIINKLEKLGLILSDEGNKFDIKIFIQETEEKAV